MEQYTGNVRPY